MKFWLTILKYHAWYLSQIPLQNMLLPIQIQDPIDSQNARPNVVKQFYIYPYLELTNLKYNILSFIKQSTFIIM